MEFRGIYENGVVRPTEPLNLPDGTEVECWPAGERPSPERRYIDPRPVSTKGTVLWDDAEHAEFLAWLRRSRGHQD